MRAPHVTLPVLALLTALAAACIERPDTPQGNHAAQADRSHVQDVLVKGNPTPHHLVGARFDLIEVVGYDLSPEVPARGGRVLVTTYFRALEDIQDDWQIFIHCEDQAKVQTRFNLDHYPAGGRLHTNQWHKGDVVRDEYTLTIPSTISNLELWQGFYQGDDRLPLTNAGRGLSDGTNRLRTGVITAQ